MSEPELEDAPDPLEVVRVLKSDFDLLQAAANAAMEDYQALLGLLGIVPPAGKAPREVMYELVLPRIAGLISTQLHVEQAKSEIASAASRFGNSTKDFGGGISGVKVGQKIPGLLSGLQPMTRRERREFERRNRP